MTVVVSGSFTPSPGTVACSVLEADIASYVNAPNSSRALAKAEDFIGVAVAKLNTVLWPWMIVYQDITLVADTSDYDLASAFLAPRKAELRDGNGFPVSLLTYSDPKTFSRDHYDRKTSGTSCTYTVENAHEYGTVTLDIPPSAGFVASYPTLRLRYYQKVQPCDGSVTSLNVPHEVAMWVSWYAKAQMAAHFDPPKVGAAQAMANDMWRQLAWQRAQVETSDWS